MLPRAEARCSEPSTRTVPVSERSRSMSVRTGWASRRRRHSPGLASHMAKSALNREKGFFSLPILKLTRALLASI